MAVIELVYEGIVNKGDLVQKRTVYGPYGQTGGVMGYSITARKKESLFGWEVSLSDDVFYICTVLYEGRSKFYKIRIARDNPLSGVVLEVIDELRKVFGKYLRVL